VSAWWLDNRDGESVTTHGPYTHFDAAQLAHGNSTERGPAYCGAPLMLPGCTCQIRGPKGTVINRDAVPVG
jgi:hypothetical protein